MDHDRFLAGRMTLIVVAAAILPLAGFHQAGVRAQQPARQGEAAASERPGDQRVHFVETGLIAQRLEADAGGRFACVFGQPLPPDAENDRRLRSVQGTNLYGGPTHVAIVDLASLKVLARQPVDGEVQQALIDGDFLYWKPVSVNVINRLAMSGDPTFKQLPLQVAVEQMFFVGDDRLALVVDEDQATRIHVYERRSFSRLPDDWLSRLAFRSVRRRYGTVANHLGDDELHLAPLVIDQRTGKAKCVVDTVYGTPSLDPKTAPTSTLANLGMGDAWWRRRYSNQEVKLMGVGGATLFRIPSRTWCVSSNLPLCASMIVSGSSRNASHVLEIREVVYGKRIDELALAADGPSGVGNQAGMRFSGRNVLVAMLDKLMVFEIDPEKLTVAEPLRLLHPTLAAGSVDRPAVFQLEAKGGKPPYRFALGQKIDGVTVSETTGQVRIDFPGIWKRRVEDVSQGTQPPFQLADPQLLREIQSQRTVEEWIEKVTGVKVPAGMVATTIPLTLSATDSGGQGDRVFAQAIAVAPKHAIEEANAAAAKIRAAQHDKMIAERQGTAKSGADEDTTATRLGELEKRVRRIEAQLDTILRKLDEMSAATARDKQP
jgi:hypothetical protein